MCIGFGLKIKLKLWVTSSMFKTSKTFLSLPQYSPLVVLSSMFGYIVVSPSLCIAQDLVMGESYK